VSDNSKYRLTDAEGKVIATVNGNKLKKGYKFTLPEPESSAIIFIEKC
jgi:hypothetical protein